MRWSAPVILMIMNWVVIGMTVSLIDQFTITICQGEDMALALANRSALYARYKIYVVGISYNQCFISIIYMSCSHGGITSKLVKFPAQAR